MLAVIDIDGVLADVRHRLHHVSARPKDWRAFFAAAPDDPLLDEGARVVRALAEVHDIVYLSGRPEVCRDDTLAWLGLHDLPRADVHLRPRDDRRPGRFYKVDALHRFAESRQVAVLVDDDPLVCDAARAAGYDVLPATWMGEQPELLEAQEVDGAT
jgi:phosphoglycolate phosphatase-like HAD superfamily hydrolase